MLNKHSIKTMGYRKHAAAVVFIVIFALIGVIILTSSHASSPYSSIEASTGTLSGSAATETDANASNGSYVKFATAGGGGSSSSGGCEYDNVVAPCVGSSTTGIGGWGTPVYDDEFNATSINSADWGTGCTDYGGDLNGGTVASNVTESGGNLLLNESAAGQGACVESYETYGDATTKGFQLNGYGFVEASIWFPGSSSGSIYDWPAFWLTGDNTSTTGDETDIAEGLSGTLTATQHNWHECASLGSSTCPDNGYQQSFVSSGNLANDWHTYGIDREDGSTTIYYDGQKLGVVTTYDSGAPVRIVFNIGDGQYGGEKVYGSSATMKVNYVRVWQK